AADHGHEEVSKLLLQAGADVSAKGEHGRTPLHCAADHDHVGVARVLLHAGA
ncbi:hypothetical protein T484DRAFT_1605522, partial [Baffinella frigidus]